MAIEWGEAVSEYGAWVDIDELISDLQDNEEWAGKNGNLELQDNLQNAIMVIVAMRYELDKQWIPCSERKPKVMMDVLLQFEKNMCVGFYSQGYWNVNSGNGFYTAVLPSEDQPIAWMPLPKKSKKEDEQNG